METRNRIQYVRSSRDSEVSKRGNMLLESENLSDCTFIIGEEKKAFKACSYILALASPVFEAMFFGKLKSDEVIFSECKPDIFYKILQFIYSKEVQINSLEEAEELCRLAHKYMIPDLLNICIPLLEPKSEVDVCRALEFAILYNLDDLLVVSIEIICDKIMTVIKCPEFLTLSPEALEFICKLDHLNIPSERVLWDAVVNWASVKCNTLKLEDNAINQRKILEDSSIFKHIRFLAMVPSEINKINNLKISKDSKDSGFLSENEMMYARRKLNTKCTSLCSIRNARSYSSFLAKSNRIRELREKFNSVYIQAGETRTERFSVCSDNMLPLAGITMMSQTPPGFVSTAEPWYEEHIKISFQNSKGDKIATGVLEEKVEYMKLISISLKSIKDLNEIRFPRGTEFIIKIKFHKHGYYSTFHRQSSRLIQVTPTQEKYEHVMGFDFIH